MTKTITLFRKRLDSLVPASPEAEAALAKVPAGDLIRVELRRMRNPEHHRKLFALLGLVLHNQTTFKTIDQLLNAIKIYTGHCESMTTPSGHDVLVPQSISYASMDQTAFEEFYSKVIDIVAEHIIPGIDREDLRKEVESFL